MIWDFIKALVKYLPAQIAPAIMGLVTIPIVSRLFPPADYGNYVLVMATVSILSTIAVDWLDNSIIRFYPAYELKGELGYFYSTVLRMALVSIAAISVLFLGILFFGQEHITTDLRSLMHLGVLVFILTAFFNVLQTFLRAKRQVHWYTSFTVWHSVARVGLGIALIIMWRVGVEGLLWGSVLSIVVAIPLLSWLSIRKGVSMKGGVSLPLASQMARYGFPLVVGFLTFWVLSLSDRYILEIFRGGQEVGIYSASYNISEQTIFMLSSLFILASGPISMDIWEKQGVEASQAFLTELTRYYLLICLPATVGLSVLAKPIIDVMAAPEYYLGYQIVPLVASGAFLHGLAQRFQAPLTYYKKTSIIMACSLIPAILNLGLNFLLIPKYGYMAAAVTTFVCYSLDLFLKVFASRKFLIWGFPLKFLGKAAMASAVMGIAVYLLGNSLTASALVNLPIAIVVGVMIYFGVLFLLGGFYPEEMEALKAAIVRLSGGRE